MINVASIMKPTNSMKINTKTGKNIFKKILNKINPSRLSSAILSSFKVTCSYLVTFQFKPSNKSWKSHFWNFFHQLWKKCHWIQLICIIFHKKTGKTCFLKFFWNKWCFHSVSSWLTNWFSPPRVKPSLLGWEVPSCQNLILDEKFDL